MADVGEERSRRSKFFDVAERALDGRVRRMRPMPKGVQEQHIQALQLTEGFFGNLTVIGQVGGGAQAETINQGAAVQERDRDDLQSE